MTRTGHGWGPFGGAHLRAVALGLAIAVGVAGLSAAQGAGAQSDRTDSARIVTTGEGRVSARPDMATISLGAQAEAATAAAAMQEVSRRIAALLAQLDAAGIAERDRQTSGLSLNPVWDHSAQRPDGRPRITGFAASNTLTVRVRDLPALGGVLDRVLEAGANDFGGLSFGLQEPRPQEDDARRRAVADARAQAELLAEAAGVTLGPVLLIVEDPAPGGGPMPYFRADSAMMAEAVPVAEGEIDVLRRVRVEWAILP